MSSSSNLSEKEFGLTLNGRFLGQSTTGVQRVAHELWRAIECRVNEVEGPANWNLRVSLPRSVNHGSLSSKVTCGCLAGQLWEQLELPLTLGDTWLLSPCNLGPLAQSKQLIVIHDAQVYLTPEAYSSRFRNWYQFILPKLARRARLVVTVSDYSRRMLEEYRVVPKGKAIVVPNGGDHILSIDPTDDILARHKLDKGGYFLAIGSLSRHKNLTILLEAMTLRGRNCLPLVIAGGGSASVFAKYNLTGMENVKFLGRVEDGELKSLYENATALLFPSIFEGFGLPPIEAMYCGCPVVASDAASIPEVCGKAALYASPYAASTWVDAMDVIEKNDGVRKKLVYDGAYHCRRFTWEACANSILSVIREQS